MTNRRRVVALAWLGLSVAGLALPTSAPAGAAPTICVGVVVSPAALGGATSTYCAKVADGSTGSQILYARAVALGRPSPTYRRDGLLCTIDGLPAGGCGSTDATHYWSYWHRPAGAGSWQYSNEGSATYRPGDRSEEGWSWQNGGSGEAASPPPLLSVDSICPPTAAPPAAAPPAQPTTVGTSPGAGTGSAARLASTPAATPAGKPTAPSAADVTPEAAPTAVGDPPSSSGAMPATPADPAGQADPAIPQSAQPRAASRRTPGSGPSIGLLAGILLVGGLGTAAGLRARRAR